MSQTPEQREAYNARRREQRAAAAAERAEEARRKAMTAAATAPRSAITVRTPENRRVIINALKMGASRSGAAGFAGIGRRTLFDWIEQDPEFAAEVAIATEGSELTFVNVMYGAAKDDWRAAAWMLERRFPDLYGARARVDMSVDISRAAREVALDSGLSEEEVADIVRAAEAIAAGSLSRRPEGES